MTLMTDCCNTRAKNLTCSLMWLFLIEQGILKSVTHYLCFIDNDDETFKNLQNFTESRKENKTRMVLEKTAVDIFSFQLLISFKVSYETQQESFILLLMLMTLNFFPHIERGYTN